jgi:hypothetical protein
LFLAFSQERLPDLNT